MPTRAIKKQRKRVITHDLVEGIAYVLIIQGWPGYAPDRDRTREHRYAFDLSMWQAFLWLTYKYEQMGREDDIRFRIRPHVLHGDSGEVRNAIGGMLGFAFRTWVPGNGNFDCKISTDSAEHMLEYNAIDRELLNELSRRFRWEYDFAVADRTWPPDFDFEREFGRSLEEQKAERA